MQKKIWTRELEFEPCYQEYEEKQRLMLEEKAQMDSCPNWIEMYENKNKRRLRPRDAKDDKPDDPLSISIQVSHNLIEKVTII